LLAGHLAARSATDAVSYGEQVHEPFRGFQVVHQHRILVLGTAPTRIGFGRYNQLRFHIAPLVFTAAVSPVLRVVDKSEFSLRPKLSPLCHRSVYSRAVSL
jgi:hypothetical protein